MKSKTSTTGTVVKKEAIGSSEKKVVDEENSILRGYDLLANEVPYISIIKNSKHFDEDWYKNNYEDLKNLNIDFAQHYLKFGWKEGKSPSFSFSNVLYIESNKNLSKLDINPLVHYELYGKINNVAVYSYVVEAIFTSEYFDSDFYNETYGLSGASRLEACLDYLTFFQTKKQPSPYFNSDIYLSAYKDVEAAKVAPLVHYELHGKKEKRKEGVNDPSARYMVFENKDNIDNPARRICLFACYMGNGVIPEETIYLLEKVRNISDAVIIVGDCGIQPSELEKIKHLVCYAKFERHLEYDFGSYKRAFSYADDQKLLLKADEILVCNDSVVGPCGELNDFFVQREKDGNPDFYGVTINNYGFRDTTSHGNSIFSPHIQSYFFTITKKVFSSDFWRKFIYSVKSQEHKVDIIRKYEMGMSKLLSDHGYPPQSMYQSKAGLNPAARECMEVLNTALFIKKSMLPGLSPERSGIVNGIFKAKQFPFELKNNKIFPSYGNTLKQKVFNSKLKVIDSKIVNETVILFTASESNYANLELLISSEHNLSKIFAECPTELSSDSIYEGIIQSYLQQGLITYTFKFDLSQIASGASLHFSNLRKPVNIGYIYGDLPCYNFMKHKDFGLYPRIEKNALILATKEKSIISIMLSNNYSQDDKKLYASIVNNEDSSKYNLFAERGALACDNAFESFKYSLERDNSCFYVTSRETIANETDPKIKKHLVELGSATHREMFLNAKNLFCSFGYLGILFSGLRDIHITALNYKLYLMWHGISAGDKNSYEIAAFNGSSCDGVFVCSPHEETNFRKLGHEKVYLSGYPRMDKWYNDDVLDPNSLILFFTWRKNLYQASLAEFLSSEYVKTIVDLVVKITKERPTLTIYYFIHNSVPHQHIECLAAILRTKSQSIRFVNNNDTPTFNRVFSSSQYLITDYSSVGYDFAYHKTRAPIFYMPKRFIDGHYMTTNLFEKIKPGVKALDLKTVINALKPNEYKKHLANKDLFFAHKDGKNCERIYNIFSS